MWEFKHESGAGETHRPYSVIPGFLKLFVLVQITPLADR